MVSVSKVVNKLKSRTTLVILFLGILIFLGLGFIGTKVISVTATPKYATGDSFDTKLLISNNSIEAGKSVTVYLQLANINVSSGDKGIGALSFVLNYDKNVFANVEMSSSVATITKNDSTGKIVLVMNDASVVKNDTVVLNLTFTSLSSINSEVSNISISNIEGTSGDTIISNDVSTSIKVEDDGLPIISFNNDSAFTYKKSQSFTVNVTDSSLDNNSLKYIWTQSTTAPSEESFTNSFTNGGVITKNTGTGNNWYLWIIAKDTKGNMRIKSHRAYLDNTNPTCNIQRNGTSLIVTGSDAHSGLSNTPYSWDGINYTTSNTKEIANDGLYEVYVKDNAGNSSKCSLEISDINNSFPTISVSSPSSTAVQNKNIKIDVTKGSNELSSSNEYKYFLSTELNPNSTNNLTTYTSGEYFKIGEGYNDIYYLFVKSVKDNHNNESKYNGDVVLIEGENYHRFGPYIFDNTKPTCTITSSTTKWTKDSVILTVNSTDKNELLYSWDGVNYRTNNKNTLSNNGDYTAYVKDEAGNLGSCSFTINNIDKESPIVTMDKNGSSVYSTEVSTVVNVSDVKSGVLKDSLKYQWTKSTVEPSYNSFTESFLSGDTITKKTGSGEWYLWIYSQDNAGVVNVVRSNPFYLDNANPTVPVITGNVDSGIETSSNVTLNVDGSTALSGILKYQYSFNGGASWLDYDNTTGIVISDEGLTNVVARAISKVGKVGAKSQEYVVNIKHTPMVLTINRSTYTTTNQDVIVTIKSTTQLRAISGWTLSSDGYSLTKAYSQNTLNDGDVIEVTDISGNTEKQTIKITNIDKNINTPKVTYKKEIDSVLVSINADEKLQSLEGWTLASDKKSLTRKYLKNTSENVTIMDLAGNTKVVPIYIKGIVENGFVVTTNYDEATNHGLKVTINSNKQLQQLDGWTMQDDKYSMYKYYDSNIREEINVLSVDGESKTIKLNYDLVVYDWDVKVNYSKQELTNENVIVSVVSNTELRQLDGWELSNDRCSLTKIYSQNKKESITIETIEGNSKTINIEVKNIDKDKPELLNYQNNGVYNSLKISFNKKVNKVTIVKDGKDLDYKIGTDIEYMDEGNYIITVEDEAGNISVYNIVVKNNKTLVDVPNTKSNMSKLFIILGVIEIILGIILFTKFGIKGKVNIVLVLALVVVAKLGSSHADNKTALDLCGYKINTGYLYNIEANTTYSQMKSNLDDNTVLIKRNNTELSASDLIRTGDLVTYGNTTYPMIISGDINSDGKVDNADKDYLTRYLISISNFTGSFAKDAANYNQDKTVDVSDLYLLNKRLVKGYKIKVKGIKASASDIRVGSTGNIETKIYPVNADNKTLKYSVVSGSNNSSIPNSSQNIVKGLGAGSSIILVSSTDGVNAGVSINIKNSYKLHVINIESGGDAMILECNGHYGMIDTGTPTAYTKISKKLDELGVSKLDFMIITHNHIDHIGSALEIANNYKVANLYIKKYSGNDIVTDEEATETTLANRMARYQKVIDAVSNSGGNVKYISSTTPKNNKLTLDAFNIQLFNLGDHLINCSGKTTENINSVTELLQITIGSKTINTYLEADLTNSVCKHSSGKNFKEVVYNQVLDVSPNIDVYKVGHHAYFNGTNSNEINALKPKIAFATSSQDVISGKPRTNIFSSIDALHSYFGSNFNSNFKLASKSVITIDYTSGTPKMTGGSSWEFKMTGDVNLDGKVTTADVALLNSHLSGTKKLTGQALKNADVYQDGVVDENDVNFLNQYVKGSITELPYKPA